MSKIYRGLDIAPKMSDFKENSFQFSFQSGERASGSFRVGNVSFNSIIHGPSLLLTIND